jgi:transposase-like protein
MEGDNVYTKKTGARECRICRRESARRSRQKLAPTPDHSKSKSLTDGTNVKASDVEVETALTILAANSGNIRRSARQIGMPPSSLKVWKNRFHERYLELVEENVPLVRNAVVEQSIEIATRAGELEQEAMEELAKQLGELSPKDLSNALRNVSVTKGVSLTHADKYQSPPAQPQENLDQAVILKELARLGVVKVIDSTASEEPVQDAEVVE